ncbi:MULTISPECIES: glycoside hydrolase family 6 protein [unclassified Curtobacterium]|uniref:glycoside hydrolase family 6 protein n=1 Tax=unclassified Curtobacterium TaxID=257496 RepID=UPI0037FC666D
MRTSTSVAAGIALVAVVCGILAPVSAEAATTAADLRSRSAAQLYGAGQYVSPTSEAAKNATALASTDPAGAAAAATIARYPVATWLGEWSTGTTLTKTISAATAGAAAAGTTAVFVTYAVPERDCGGYSSGGFDETSYNAWVDQVVAAVAGKRAAVIVEPDSLAMLSDTRCTPALDQQRYRILAREVAAFAAAGVPAYLDAGNSNWVQPAVMAERLNAAGVQRARGFFTNVANYYPTAQEQTYAQKVSALTGGSHYVIDTSRNGTGWRGTWCNGPGAGLGASPRVATDGTALDALLWVKTPGASDGTCNGGPAAGKWYSAYAQSLVANAATAGPTGSGVAAGAAEPRVALESATVAAAGIAVRGWAYDPDDTGTALAADVRVDGAVVRTLTAGLTRKDVDTVTGAGPAHGYAGVVPAAAGRHTVCVVARSSGSGTERTSPCSTVQVAASAPVGRVDQVSSSAHRRVEVRGWAFDRDGVARAVAVSVTIGGKRVAGVQASGRRADVDRAYGSGAAHGYVTTLAVASGKRTVCVTATGIGPGGDAALGCRTITVR